MRRVVWLTVLGVVALGGLMGWSGEALAASTVQAKLSQQVAGGGVTVMATLLKDQADATAIKLVFDTHSANLDGYKLDAIATLRDDGQGHRGGRFCTCADGAPAGCLLQRLVVQ